jgi:addiction module HigA family antidote
VIVVRIPTHREPFHPGEILRTEFLEPLEITQRELAEAIRVPYQRVNEIVNRRRGITASTALRLAKFFGTTPELWINFQTRWDLYWAERNEARELKAVVSRR